MQFCRRPNRYEQGRQAACAGLFGHILEAIRRPAIYIRLPLSDAPLRQALKWRLDRLIKHFPQLQRRLARRNVFFDFQGGVFAEAHFFRERIGALKSLSPPLVPEAAAQRLEDLLEGRIRATEQASTLLPPALFIQALEQVLDLSKASATRQ